MPAAEQVEAPVPSENILNAKTDLCISNALVKASIGLGAGVVASAILFRRYSDCERIFNPAAIPGFVIAGEPASPYTLKNPFSASTTASAEATAEKVKAKASELVAAVKDKADDFKDKAEDVKEKTEAKIDKVEKKIEKKWV